MFPSAICSIELACFTASLHISSCAVASSCSIDRRAAALDAAFFIRSRIALTLAFAISARLPTRIVVFSDSTLRCVFARVCAFCWAAARATLPLGAAGATASSAVASSTMGTMTLTSFFSNASITRSISADAPFSAASVAFFASSFTNMLFFASSSALACTTASVFSSAFSISTAMPLALRMHAACAARAPSSAVSAAFSPRAAAGSARARRWRSAWVALAAASSFKRFSHSATSDATARCTIFSASSEDMTSIAVATLEFLATAVRSTADAATSASTLFWICAVLSAALATLTASTAFDCSTFSFFTFSAAFLSALMNCAAPVFITSPSFVSSYAALAAILAAHRSWVFSSSALTPLSFVSRTCSIFSLPSASPRARVAFTVPALNAAAASAPPSLRAACLSRSAWASVSSATIPAFASEARAHAAALAPERTTAVQYAVSALHAAAPAFATTSLDAATDASNTPCALPSASPFSAGLRAAVSAAVTCFLALNRVLAANCVAFLNVIFALTVVASGSTIFLHSFSREMDALSTSLRLRDDCLRPSSRFTVCGVCSPFSTTCDSSANFLAATRASLTMSTGGRAFFFFFFDSSGLLDLPLRSSSFPSSTAAASSVFFFKASNALSVSSALTADFSALRASTLASTSVAAASDAFFSAAASSARAARFSSAPFLMLRSGLVVSSTVAVPSSSSFASGTAGTAGRANAVLFVRFFFLGTTSVALPVVMLAMATDEMFPTLPGVCVGVGATATSATTTSLVKPWLKLSTDSGARTSFFPTHTQCTCAATASAIGPGMPLADSATALALAADSVADAPPGRVSLRTGTRRRLPSGGYSMSVRRPPRATVLTKKSWLAIESAAGSMPNFSAIELSESPVRTTYTHSLPAGIPDVPRAKPWVPNTNEDSSLRGSHRGSSALRSSTALSIAASRSFASASTCFTSPPSFPRLSGVRFRARVRSACRAAARLASSSSSVPTRRAHDDAKSTRTRCCEARRLCASSTACRARNCAWRKFSCRRASCVPRAARRSRAARNRARCSARSKRPALVRDNSGAPGSALIVAQRREESRASRWSTPRRRASMVAMRVFCALTFF